VTSNVLTYNDTSQDADGFETWKKQQREKLKSMISTLTQVRSFCLV
jgi:hypothetical protein